MNPEPVTKEIFVSVEPHPSEKRPGYNVLATRIIRMGDQVIEDRMVLQRFRRVKSDQNHRKSEANEYAQSIGKFFTIMDIRTL